MACLNLANGNFAIVQFNNADTNVGDVTITNQPDSILVEHVNFVDGLFLQGRWESHVFAGGTRVALLRFFDVPPGSAQRTIFVVDFTGNGNTPTLVQVHDQGTVQNATSRPQLLIGPGNASLIFVWSSTGQPNEVQRLSIHRSDNGAVVMNGPLMVTGLNGNVGASITANSLVIDHPNQFNNNDSTTGPRPAGECNIVDDNPQLTGCHMDTEGLRNSASISASVSCGSSASS